LIAQAINRIDATGVEVFLRLRDQLLTQQCDWVVVGLKLPVERVLKAAGCLHQRAYFALYVSEAELLESLRMIKNNIKVF
jgi:SulP family sulfate permease